MTPSLLQTLIYADGQVTNEEDTIILPLLKDKGILHAISGGPKSQNMSEFHDKEPPEVIDRQRKFLEKNGFASLENSFASIVPRESDPTVVDITQEFVETHKDTSHFIHAEALFTKLSGIPLLHRPADCPTAIIKATDKNGETILGVAHLGRPQINSLVTEKVLEHLFSVYEAPPETIFIGIAPSISPVHYTIKTKDQNEKNLLDLSYWGEFAKKDSINSEDILRVNVLGKSLSTLSKASIPEENIQAYGQSDQVDTYSLAAMEPPLSFSYRYSVETKQPEKNGRIMIAAQLL